MIEIGVMAGGHASGGAILGRADHMNVNPYILPEQMMAMNSNAANGAQPKRVKKAKRKKKKKTHKHMAIQGKLPNGAVIMQPNMHTAATPPFMMTKTAPPPGSTPPHVQTSQPPPPPPMIVQKNSIIEISSGRRHSHGSKSPFARKGPGKNNKRVSPHSFPAHFNSYDAFVGLFNVKPDWVRVGMPGEITTICTVKFVTEIRDVKLVQVSPSEFEVFLNTNATCKQLMKILEHAQNSNVESAFHLEIRKVGNVAGEFQDDTRLADVITPGRETVQVYGMLTQQGRCCVIS